MMLVECYYCYTRVVPDVVFLRIGSAGVHWIGVGSNSDDIAAVLV